LRQLECSFVAADQGEAVGLRSRLGSRLPPPLVVGAEDDAVDRGACLIGRAQRQRGQDLPSRVAERLRTHVRHDISGRRAGNGFLEAYEQNLQTFADYQDKVGDETEVDWIANVARAQANFTRELTRVYTTTARDLLK